MNTGETMNAELPFEELLEAWKDDSASGEYIAVNDNGTAYYDHKLIAPAKDGNPDFAAIRAWCEAQKYWPNVWQSNDHGNVSLFTLNGEYLGGIV